MAEEYDKEQLRIMRNAFKAFDHDEKGTIDYADVQTILEILGQKLDDKAIKALLKEVDPKASGKLDFSQFCRLASRFVEVEEDANALAGELKEAFRVYDKEGKGYLTVQTLRDILHELDDKLSNNDLDMIIEEIDADGSGTVDFDEFMQVMTGKNCYDLTVKRHFVFEPSVPKPHCYCPARRQRLHRRIEWHFERFFKQFLEPFELPKRCPTNICSNTTTTTAATNSHTTCSTTNRPKQLSPSTLSMPTPPPLPPPTPIPTSMPTSRLTTTTASKTIQCTSKCCLSNKAITACCCYRPTYRPRFPKWVPIFTLYREILQNPFRRRSNARLMITYN